MPSVPRPQKCVIKNLDGKDPDLDILEACFNPKELGIEKKVPWNKHKDSKANTPMLEFTDAEPQELSIELLFDGYEARENVYAAYVSKLERFTKIIEERKRPPMCIFLWGGGADFSDREAREGRRQKGFPSFMGVIESLSTKYTMFLPDGTPVRATCTVKMKQADTLIAGPPKDKKPKKPKKPPPPVDYTKAGSLATEAEILRADKFGADHRRVLDANNSEDGTIEPGSRVTGG